MEADTRLEAARDEAAARRAALTHTVSDDLEAIFRPARTAPAAPSAKVQSFVPAPGRERSHGRLGALAAAALAGLALGAVIMGPSGRGPKPAARVETTPAASVAPAPAPALTRAPARALPVELAQAPAPVAPAARPQGRPAAAGVATPKRTTTRAKTPKAATGAGRCERLGGEARARCAYPAVMAADRRLRRAYAQATRAGVSRARLVAVRSRWASLRHEADTAPGRVVVAYDRMAADLMRAARQARS